MEKPSYMHALHAGKSVQHLAYCSSKQNLNAYSFACLIKPKSQMGLSYPPNLVHILILLGVAKKIKFLAVPEVRLNLT